MEYQNHVIDPTYFFDAIEEFSFNFRLFVKVGQTEPDDYGRIRSTYNMQTIRGSLQPTGKRINRNKAGNTETKGYNFYCKALYRIDIGDILEYKDNYYICVQSQDYDEYGVRSAEFSMIELTSYRDFADYLKYLKGEKLI